MITSPPAWVRKKSRSHTIESASRWLVGSSSSNVPPSPASLNRIRASSTRRRWPPESVRKGWEQRALRKPQICRNTSGIRLRRIATERREAVLELAVAGQGLLVVRVLAQAGW